MGTLILIEDMSINNLNKAEKTDLAKRYKALIDRNSTSSSEPEGPEVQAEEPGYEKLNIPQKTYERFGEIVEQLSQLTMQSTAKEETSEMQQVASDRDRVMQYCVRKILDGDNLPLASEREAAKQLTIIATPYKGFYRLPIMQRQVVAEGFIKDVKDAKYSEAVSDLGIGDYLDELQRLIDSYNTLSAQRSTKRTEQAATATVGELSDELEDLLDDMNAYANATSLLEPSAIATQFVNEVNNLFDEIRIARNMRDSGSSDDKDDEDNDDKPVTDDGPQVQ